MSNSAHKFDNLDEMDPQLYGQIIFNMGRLGGTAVGRLPSAQGVIRRYGIEPHIGLLRCEPASSSPTPPACAPSLAGCLSLSVE